MSFFFCIGKKLEMVKRKREKQGAVALLYIGEHKEGVEKEKYKKKKKKKNGLVPNSKG